MRTPGRISAILMLALVLLAGSGTIEKSYAQPAVGISLNLFYDELAPYGEWMTMPGHGRVWRPRVSGDFRPYYTNGYWTMTEYGNTWVSDYDWGWAPFHYGRWTYDPYYGWVWIPDVHWGPAWVVWRNGGGYYGWAPMGPGVNISVSIGSHYNMPYDWWVFIPQKYITHRHFHRYYRGPKNNVTIINNTTIINNIHEHDNRKYVYGPRKNEIERVTGKSVRVRNIQTQNGPRKTTVQGNTVNIYRPDAVRQTPTNATRNSGQAPRQNATQPRNTQPATNNRTAVQQRNNAAPRTNTTAQPVRNNPVQQRATQTPQNNNTVNQPVRNAQPTTAPRTTVQPARQNNATQQRSTPAAQPNRATTPANRNQSQSRANAAPARVSAQPARNTPSVQQRNSSPASKPQMVQNAPARSSAPAMRSQPTNNRPGAANGKNQRESR